MLLNFVNNMIKGIIFDFGNVISNFDNNIFLKKIAKHTEKTISELNELIYQKSDLVKKYETGLITSDEFFESIVMLCNLKISKEEFIKAYTSIFTPIKTTFDLIRKLKPNYRLALLSNTSEWDFNFGIKTTDIFNLFDAVILSYEVKEMKPGKKLFLEAINKLNLKPEECTYIDDIEEYVNAANQMGINSILYKSYDILIDELRKLKVNI